MNKLCVNLGTIKVQSGTLVIETAPVVILETPCFPAKFYAGYGRFDGKEWLPCDNDTYFWHRTMEDAELGALLLLARDVSCV